MDNLYKEIFSGVGGAGRANDFDKDVWGEKKQAEKAEAYETIDKMTGKIGASPLLLRDYLDIQSRFISYSVSNAMLIMAQRPKSTHVAGSKFWNNRNVFIRQGEKGITILEPSGEFTREDGSRGVSYSAKKVFDVSQVKFGSEAIRQEQVPGIMSAIKALIHASPVPIVPLDEPESQTAVLDPEKESIFIAAGMDAPELFRELSREIAHAGFLKVDPAYDRSIYKDKADCVSYMLCKRNGVSPPDLELDALISDFASKDAGAVKGFLSDMRNVASAISDRMSQLLTRGLDSRESEHEQVM